jgi:hypothetical protein
VVDTVAQPANQAEHDARETLGPALEAHGPLRSLSMDRASLSRPLLGALTAHGLDRLATPWPWRNRGRFPTAPLQITRDRHEGTCPAGGMVRLTGAGRQALRQRTAVAQTCARLDQRQGQRVRYQGARKTPRALRRPAAVHTLQPLHRGQALERVA